MPACKGDSTTGAHCGQRPRGGRMAQMVPPNGPASKWPQWRRHKDVKHGIGWANKLELVLAIQKTGVKLSKRLAKSSPVKS